MRFDLFLLIFITEVFSSINVNLYQCHTNATSTVILDTIGDDRPYSCSTDCCAMNSSKSINVCQISVQSSTGFCLGRLCYPDECEKFTSVPDSQVKNTTKSIMNQLSSSFASIPWSSLINSTETKLSSLVGQTGLTLRHVLITTLLIVNISLTSMTLIIVIKSIRQANMFAEDRSYRYTLL